MATPASTPTPTQPRPLPPEARVGPITLDHKRVGRSIRIPDQSISTYLNIPPGTPKPTP